MVAGSYEVDGGVGEWQACVCLRGVHPCRGHLYCGLGSIGRACGRLSALVSIVLLPTFVPAHVVPGQEIAFDNPFGVAVVDSEVVLE